MGKALGIIGIAAGAILIIIGFLTFFVVFRADLHAATLVVPIIIMIVGALLLGYGQRLLSKIKTSSTRMVKSVFCRHCGKKAVTGEYCSVCGKSSQSTSVTMKICRGCNSAMSEDSQYCTNCGKKFLET